MGRFLIYLIKTRSSAESKRVLAQNVKLYSWKLKSKKLVKINLLLKAWNNVIVMSLYRKEV